MHGTDQLCRMWTTETCRRHDRRGLGYTHDLTDEERAAIEPQIPPAKPGGNKRTVNIREIVNGLMYILGTGCQWRDIPKDLPPCSTIHDYLVRWGVLNSGASGGESGLPHSEAIREICAVQVHGGRRGRIQGWLHGRIPGQVYDHGQPPYPSFDASRDLSEDLGMAIKHLEAALEVVKDRSPRPTSRLSELRRGRGSLRTSLLQIDPP